MCLSFKGCKRAESWEEGRNLTSPWAYGGAYPVAISSADNATTILFDQGLTLARGFRSIRCQCAYYPGMMDPVYYSQPTVGR